MFCLWWIAGGKCLCIFREVILCLTYFGIRILIPRSYSKLWNYIYCPSVRASVGRVRRSCPSWRFRRPLSVVILCLSVRPVVRHVVVRPLSVRPSPSRRRRTLSVRTVVRPVVVLRPVSVRPVVRLNYYRRMPRQPRHIGELVVRATAAEKNKSPMSKRV